MGDSKYGRLYTEADVRRLLDIADSGALRALPPLEQLIKDAGEMMTFPADEPLFLLRGSDLATHAAVWTYAFEAGQLGASIEAVTDMMRTANDLRDWARANRDRMQLFVTIDRTSFSVEQLQEAIEYAVSLAWETPEPTAPPSTLGAIVAHVLENAKRRPPIRPVTD